MKQIKKGIVYTLAGSMLVGNVSPALAYTYKDSVADVEYTDLTENGTNNTTVYAEVGSSFKVTIPKHIILNGSTKSGAYTVGVEGDIAGTEVVNVVPDESFALKSNNLKDVTATINQDKTSWGYAEMLEGSAVIGNGAIDAKDITAGSWNGNFNFNINLETGEVNKEPVALEAGLYDANGVMLCTWEEAGINVEMDFGKNDEEENYFGYTETSGRYVLTNKYPTATKVVIPEGITKIGQCAFNNCTNLTSITIPKSVTEIRNQAFEDCTNLTSITIPKGVTSIGDYAFSYCKGLTSITIPDSVTSIGENAFYYCYFQETDIINNSSLNTEENNYWGAIICDEYIDGMRIKDNKIVSVNKNDLPENVIVPEGVTNIGTHFVRTNITSITIPSTVTSLAENALMRCPNLITVILPETLTYIGPGAFYKCENLTNIEIPSSVTLIKYDAFEGCPNLTITWNGSTYTYADKEIFNQALKDAGIATSDVWIEAIDN